MSPRSEKMAGWTAILALALTLLVPGRGMAAAIEQVTFGGPGYSPVMGDYNGDGKADLTTYQSASGTWTVNMITNWTGFGDTNSIPIMGDFDNDSKSDPGIYNTLTGKWTIRYSRSDYAPQEKALGGPGWKPVAGDFDGDQKADFAVYQESTGDWDIQLSSASYVTTNLPGFLGGPGWTAVAGDFDFAGMDMAAVYQESTGDWRWTSPMYANPMRFYYPGLLGGPGYQALAGDYDGDGLDNYIVYQEASGIWLILEDTRRVPIPWMVDASEGTYTDKVRVTWSAVASVTNYEVWRSEVYDSGAAEKLGETSATTYDDFSAAGFVYYYWIKAKIGDATSDFGGGAQGWLQSTYVPIFISIKANNSDGPVIIDVGETFNVAIRVYPAEYTGFAVDWWVVAETPVGWYCFSSSDGNNATGYQWMESNGGLASVRPVLQGGLFNLMPTTVFGSESLPNLPSGLYTFWFAVDTPMDGILNLDGTILCDSVKVTVQ